MPFPNVNRAPTSPNACRTANIDARDELLARIAGLAQQFDLEPKVPVRAAAISYLGLLRLKMSNDAGGEAIRSMSARCKELMNILQPETGTKSVNCSWFSGEGNTYLNHCSINSAAMSIYLPNVRSKKKQSLVLLALGAEHDDSVQIPSDDSWIKGYIFKAR